MTNNVGLLLSVVLLFVLFNFAAAFERKELSEQIRELRVIVEDSNLGLENVCELLNGIPMFPVLSEEIRQMREVNADFHIALLQALEMMPETP